MKKTMTMIALIVMSMGVFSETREEMGYRLMEQSNKNNEGFLGEETNSQMTLINAYGDKVIRKMKSKTRELISDGDQFIFEFLWPADVKGTKMLTWSHKTRNDDQWLYLPALKRVKRISATNKSGSFMGSEFSYEDVGSEEIEKYTYKFIKEGKINDRQVVIIERVPVDKKSGYSKQIIYLDQTYNWFLKVEYFDRKGEHLKTAIHSNFEQYGKFWRPNEISIVNHQTKKSSILNWTKRKLFVKSSASEFRKNSLIK